MSDGGIARGVRGRSLPNQLVGLELCYELHGDDGVVEHRRQVVLPGPDRALVHDVFTLPAGEATWPLTWRWHLTPAYRAIPIGSPSFEITSAGRPVARVRMDGTGVTGERRQGWVSPSYGRKEAADVLVFHASARGTAAFVCELTYLV